MFQIITGNEGQLRVESVSSTYFYVVLGVIIAVVLAFYALRAIGVYKLAKASDGNLKNIAYFAFIPFLWIYLTARLAGKISLFGKPVQKFALILVILFTVTELVNIVYFFLTYYPIVGYFLSGGNVAVFFSGVDGSFTSGDLLNIGYKEYFFDGTFFTGLNINYPYKNIELVQKICNAISIVNYVLTIVNLVFMIFFYIAFFKRYYPQHFILATVLCVWLNAFPIFVFIIRNRKPINYNDYLRERYNYYYNNAQGPNTPYNNPYATNNPNDPNLQRPITPPSSPFPEFLDKTETPDEPFSEFEKKDDGKD